MPSPTHLVIGGAVVDVSLCPVDAGIFSRHSSPIERIPMSSGGDAMNEASVLAQLGGPVRLVTLLGEDAAGSFLLSRCHKLGIDTAAVVQNPSVDTSVNVVLVEPNGERRFVTARNSSLRRLSPKHILPALEGIHAGTIVSFASIFVSHCCGPADMEEIFRRVHQAGCILCADMTTAKNGETSTDLKGALQYVDYLFPNLEEGALLTGKSTPQEIALELHACGAKHVIVKLGEKGCYFSGPKQKLFCPAYPGAALLDTTGAGDTFAASFQLALSQGKNIATCLRFANAAASICVEHPGCASENLTTEEILRRMESISPAKVSS